MIPTKGVVMLTKIWPGECFNPLLQELGEPILKQCGEGAYWKVMSRVRIELYQRSEAVWQAVVNQLREALR